MSKSKSSKFELLTFKAKGEPGYIKAKKKNMLFATIVFFLIAAGIFAIGLALNKGEKGNIFTVVAALFILPMAKYATSFILFYPFKSVTDEKIADVEKNAKPGSIIYTDVVVTSEQKAMGLDFLVITSDKVLGITSRPKEDVLDVRNYLQDKITRRGYDYKVTITDEYPKFINMLKSSDSVAALQFESEEAKEAFDKERAEICEVYETLMP